MIDDKDKRIRELEEEIIRLRQEKDRIKQEKDRITQEKDRITQEKDRITQEKDRITQEKDRITQEKDKIIQEKEKIVKEFEEFRAQHAITVDNLKQAMKIKPDQKKKSKKIGALQGHKGYSRHIPNRIDFIRSLNPARCPHCNTKLGNTQEIRHRYATDIQLVTKAKTTKYEIHRKYCVHCKKLVEKEVPNVLPHAKYGLNIMLLVMYLKLGLRLPYNKICDYFMTMYSVNLGEGEVVGILKQLANAFGDYYLYLEKLIKLTRVKHTDSTSWKISGKNYFAWVFVAAGIVIYKIRKRNNHKVGLTLFGKNQDGKILVVDRHSAHRTLATKTGFMLQFCWSHILKESKELSKYFGTDGKYVHKRLKEIYSLAIGLNHNGTEEIVEQLQGEIIELLDRSYKSKKIWKFVKGLNRDLDGLFRFVTDPEIDSTNNISERELRALVIIRKISNGSRSPRGASACAMLLSIIETLRLHKKNVLEGLCEIINNTSGY